MYEVIRSANLIAFPLIERVVVQRYALYPGQDHSGELDLELGLGPWLVLGVNGLGKSTLLLLLRYLLTGPVRTRSAGFAGEREDLQAVSNRFFAVRVAGGADQAIATIVVKFGNKTLTVERSIANLSLNYANITDAVESKIFKSEDDYRTAITNLMGVTQFEDVVRVLDHLIFYLEGRQSLIWDLAAQFELFRALLTPTLSADLRRLEGEIVSADSAARNLNATLYKITQRRERETNKRVTANDTRARIAAAQGELDKHIKDELTLTEQLEAAEILRGDCNLQRKRGEKLVDDAAQAYEKLKFDVLRQAFAGVSTTDQYLYLKLLSEQICIACNQPAPDAAAELQKRHDEGRCVVCGNPRNIDDKVETISSALKAKAEEAFKILESRRDELDIFQQQYLKANDAVYALHNEVTTVRAAAEDKQSLIRWLRKNLPAEESLVLSREEERIRTLRSEVLAFRHERETAELRIENLLVQLSRAVEQVRGKLEIAFQEQAAPFFAESVRLVYAPRTAKIGQGGRSFDFPAFEVEMTSGATLGQFVRRAPEQVSLSQREYLDIIFRMVLVNVLGAAEGSLVVDGPEGSLDAVFAGRAGDLFARFSAAGETNVLLACNIVEGGFIPHALCNYQRSDRHRRIINLLEQATPTEALKTLKPLYLEKVAEILERDPG
jgi:energy-coupling factor transporter ATP-binding protein EcfA2